MDSNLAGPNAGPFEDAWVARYDGAGNLLWIRQIGTDGYDRAQALCPDVRQSLRGGARYFRSLLEAVDASIVGPERELFALAAYNMGPAHVEDARRLAKMRGGDPNTWADVEKQLPLLSQRAWRSRTQHGYARGYEAASFVNRIRQYHRFLEHHDADAGDMLELAQNATGTVPLPSRS